MFLKQSTSAVVLVGPVLDASGVAVTTAVIGDFTITKNGTSAAMSGNTISHAHNGHYAITLTAANTDTIGRLTISVNNTAQAMPVFRWDICQPTVYDALFTNATNTSGGLPAATGAITALAGAVSTYAGGDTAGTTTLLTRLPSAISLSSGAVTVGTNNDKSGYSLTQAFPSNFASLGINSSGHVSRVTLVDTTTTNTDMRGTDNAALASEWTATRAGYLDGVLIAANYNQRTVSVTGSNHVAADIHELQAGVITAGDFAADWLTAAGLAADAVTEIQAGLATAANLLICNDRVAYALTALVGACSDAQTGAETYALTINGNTFTVDYSGLDASGNRGTTTLSKV